MQCHQLKLQLVFFGVLWIFLPRTGNDRYPKKAIIYDENIITCVLQQEASRIRPQETRQDRYCIAWKRAKDYEKRHITDQLFPMPAASLYGHVTKDMALGSIKVCAFFEKPCEAYLCERKLGVRELVRLSAWGQIRHSYQPNPHPCSKSQGCLRLAVCRDFEMGK